MTEQQPALPPANWYRDPKDSTQVRYWDGQRWTEHTQPMPQQQQQPAQQQPQAQQAHPASAQQPQVQQPAQQQPQAQQAHPASAQQPQVQQPAQQAHPASAQQPQIQQPAQQAPHSFDALLSPQSQATASQGGSPQQPGPQAAAPQQATPASNKDDDGGDNEASAEARGAVLLGALAVIAAVVVATGTLGFLGDMYDVYGTLAIGGLSLILGALGLLRLREGYGGGARAWFGLLGGLAAVGAAVYEFLNPDQLADTIFGLF